MIGCQNTGVCGTALKHNKYWKILALHHWFKGNADFARSGLLRGGNPASEFQYCLFVQPVSDIFSAGPDSSK